MREKKKKDQTRTQNVTEFGLKCLRLWDPQPLTIEVELKCKKIVLHL
jgi:very-short-patch-repair endonuclease